VDGLKNKFLFITVLLTTVFLIAGCGFNSKDKIDDEGEPVIINELDEEGNSAQSGDGYGFREFELEIEIDNKDAIDIDFDVNDGADAKYENAMTDTRLKGEEAMNEVHDLFMAVLLDKETPDDVAIDKINKHLRVENYSKFELEVEFNDGTKHKITDTK